MWEGGHDQEGAEDSILTLVLEWPLECPIVAVGDASCGLWARRAGQPLTAPPHLEADRGLWSMGRGAGVGWRLPQETPMWLGRQEELVRNTVSKAHPEVF